MNTAKTQNIISLLVGLWIFISPWTMDYSLFMTNNSIVSWNFWIVGLAITASAALALRDLRPWEEWTNLALGAWLFLSPWALAYTASSNLFWNAIIGGGAVMVLAASALPEAQRLMHQRL